MAINVNDYPYGKISKTLRKAVKHLNIHGVHGCEFDYPTFGDLPRSIASRLSSDDVDFIQENLHKVRGFQKSNCSWYKEV